MYSRENVPCKISSRVMVSGVEMFTEDISESVLGLKLALELLGIKTLIEF